MVRPGGGVLIFVSQRRVSNPYKRAQLNQPKMVFPYSQFGPSLTLLMTFLEYDTTYITQSIEINQGLTLPWYLGAKLLRLVAINSVALLYFAHTFQLAHCVRRAATVASLHWSTPFAFANWSLDNIYKNISPLRPCLHYDGRQQEAGQWTKGFPVLIVRHCWQQRETRQTEVKRQKGLFQAELNAAGGLCQRATKAEM